MLKGNGEFLAPTSQRACVRRSFKRVRKSARLIVLAVAPFMGAALSVPASKPEPAIVSSPGGNIQSGSAPRLPCFVVIMSAEAATAIFVRASLKAASDVIPPFVEALQDTWLNAFYGDKQRLKQFIDQTADASGLPVDFLLRLLQQESGLDHRAVSRAGAQGVAQFMPATAAERGLIDPFDPFEAIPKAAEFLREQRATFGSLGLAAAAYNAGPQRVRNWLAGRSSLPQETRAYVMKITGRSAEDWRQGGDLFAIAEPAARNGW